jgi:DNA-binding GntR family transcriptional regulator
VESSATLCFYTFFDSSLSFFHSLFFSFSHNNFLWKFFSRKLILTQIANQKITQITMLDVKRSLADSQLYSAMQEIMLKSFAKR